jgi:hypothetical protein
VNGKLVATAAVSPGEKRLYNTRQGAAWAPHSLWTLWSREKSLPHRQSNPRFSGRPIRSLIPVLTEPSILLNISDVPEIAGCCHGSTGCKLRHGSTQLATVYRLTASPQQPFRFFIFKISTTEFHQLILFNQISRIHLWRSDNSDELNFTTWGRR